MDKIKRQKLEAAGYWVGDAEDFLGLSHEERQLVAIRLAVSRAIRERRRKLHMTQAQLAARMKSSQSRIAKIESGAAGVSLDLMFSGLFALGGSVSDLIADAQITNDTQTPPERARRAVLEKPH